MLCFPHLNVDMRTSKITKLLTCLKKLFRKQNQVILYNLNPRWPISPKMAIPDLILLSLWHVNTSLYYSPVATTVFLDIYTFEVYLKTDLVQYSGIKAYKLNYLVETRNEFMNFEGQQWLFKKDEYNHTHNFWYLYEAFILSLVTWNLYSYSKFEVLIIFILHTTCMMLLISTLHNTVFRQAFLLIQYSFICKQYFFCSDREYQYFFDRWWTKQLIVSTTFFSFWSWKLVEKIYWKNGKQLNVGNDLMSV